MVQIAQGVHCIVMVTALTCITMFSESVIQFQLGRQARDDGAAMVVTILDSAASLQRRQQIIRYSHYIAVNINII